MNELICEKQAERNAPLFFFSCYNLSRGLTLRFRNVTQRQSLCLDRKEKNPTLESFL